jgi:hypothetical protein
MSITIIQHDPDARVTVGGPADSCGMPGLVTLDVTPPLVHLKPSIALQVADKLAKFAHAAAGKGQASSATSEAARALGASSASKAGKTSQALITPEERSRRAKLRAENRWGKTQRS